MVIVQAQISWDFSFTFKVNQTMQRCWLKKITKNDSFFSICFATMQDLYSVHSALFFRKILA